MSIHKEPTNHQLAFATVIGRIECGPITTKAATNWTDISAHAASGLSKQDSRLLARTGAVQLKLKPHMDTSWQQLFPGNP